MAIRSCDVCGTDVDARGMKAHLGRHSAEPEYATTSDDVAAAIAAAHGGLSDFDGAKIGHSPAMVTNVAGSKPEHDPREIAKAASVVVDGPRSRQPEAGTPQMKEQPLDPITRAFGAKHYRAGTDNRFDWCREFVGGPRHTFSRFYFDQNVLLDIFQARTKAVEAEVEIKTRAIAERNASSPDVAFGYVAVFIGDPAPAHNVVARALAGEAVGFALPPAVLTR